MTLRILFFTLCIHFIGYAQESVPVDSNQEFVNFLENSLNSTSVNKESTREFYQRAWKYWMNNKIDYNLNPEKYSQVISLFHLNQQKYTWDKDIKLDRFEDYIENFRRFDSRNTLAKKPILFIGSSSIVYWETSTYFPDFPIINRGFGGASIPEIIYYYNDVVKKHKPSMVVIYCDIDVENGKSPDVAVNAFKELVDKIETDFPQIQILILSMKPTLIDDFLGEDVRKNKIITNNMLKSYCIDKENLHYIDITNSMFLSDGSLKSDIFLSDGMHLNELGYDLWSPIIRNKITDLKNE
jgi:lysophospholipase L1-like esterase